VAEDPRQGADGKEKRRAGGHPAVAVDVEGAAGDDAVQVDVDTELLTPRVEDREVEPLQRLRVEEADREGGHADGTRCEMTLLGEVQQEVLYLRGVEGVRRLVVVPGQVRQGGEVQLLGGRRELSQQHLAHHAIT
jgi:hypothetical protein